MRACIFECGVLESPIHHGGATDLRSKARAEARQPTHRVPHHDVHVGAEGVVHVLRDVQVQEVAEVVIHVNTWRRKEKSALTSPTNT